jgi:hypothetical protein
MRFYKYREVRSNLEEDHAVRALFGSYAIFSSRKNFNDLLDSKIEIVHPTPKQVWQLLRDPKLGSHAAMVKGWISNGSFTAQGLRMFKTAEDGMNAIFDSYPLFSLSCHNDGHLLWAHYASSHTGICIEFEFPETNQPNKVSYRKNLESIQLLDFFKSNFGLIGVEFGERVHDALLVKLECWAYEGEYRWIADNGMGRITADANFIKVPYPTEWVKGIIFGCRTPSKTKSYIREHIPFKTDFKQAIATRDRIEIVPFGETLHL